jgi:hypothetical protein
VLKNCALVGIIKQQSSVTDDGRNYRRKHVELIEITNKLLLLHLVGCLYCCIRDARSHKHQIFFLYILELYTSKLMTKSRLNYFVQLFS